MQTSIVVTTVIVAMASLATFQPERGVLSRCDRQVDGLTIARGYCVETFAEGIGAARHITTDGRGNVFVILQAQRKGTPPGGIVALRDSNADGRADYEQRFGSIYGSDIKWHQGFLFAASEDTVVRFRIADDTLMPTGDPEVMVTGFPRFEDGEHRRKTIAFDDHGGLYVHVGAPNNSCQAQNRVAHSPGLRPCPYLEKAAGIWRFDESAAGQRHGVEGSRVATGIRYALGMAWNPISRSLYLVQEGRDELHSGWPELFSEGQSAETPSEELIEVTQQLPDFGWPYCYYDAFRNKRLLAPEYGGDGIGVGGCARYAAPKMAFPAHTSPTDIVIDSGNTMGNRRQGAYVSFHGGWGRQPFGQAGYSVLFVPFTGGQPMGRWEVFVEGFAGIAPVKMPTDAAYRPAGLTIDPQGRLYIADSKKGRIWRLSRES